MFQRLIDDVKESTGNAVRLTTLATAAGVALLVTTAFLCAAAFVFVQARYGTVEACLAGAAIFFVVTAISAGSYMVRKRQIRLRAERVAERVSKTATSSLLADPATLAIGLQVVRAIGIKRLVPILAIGGVALGVLAARGGHTAAEEPAE